MFEFFGNIDKLADVEFFPQREFFGKLVHEFAVFLVGRVFHFSHEVIPFAVGSALVGLPIRGHFLLIRGWLILFSDAMNT